MKKTLVALSILGAIGFTSANYTMKVPLEQAKGGSLPNGSINITPMNQTEEWIATTPSYSEWVNFGGITFSRIENTIGLVLVEDEFTEKTYIDNAYWNQGQRRNVQQVEKNNFTDELRNIGESEIEEKIIEILKTQTIKKCRYSSDNYFMITIPAPFTDPYPIRIVTVWDGVRNTYFEWPQVPENYLIGIGQPDYEAGTVQKSDNPSSVTTYNSRKHEICYSTNVIHY